MKKTEFIAELNENLNHLKEKTKILGMIINALSDDTKSVCVSKEACEFYKWLQAREYLLERLYGLDSFKELLIRHEEWHDECSRICALVKLKEQRRVKLVDKLFGTKKIPKMRTAEYDIAMIYFEQLSELTDTVDTIFERMLKRANALPEESFSEAS